jgi:hypothetical protein
MPARLKPAVAALCAATAFLLGGCDNSRPSHPAAAVTPKKPAPDADVAGDMAKLEKGLQEVKKRVAEIPARPAPAPMHGRPPKLAQMLMAAVSVDPTAAWRVGVRTLTPFHCQTPVAGIVRCQSNFSTVGRDGITGFLYIVIFDHDIDFDAEFGKVTRMVARKDGQTAYFARPTVGFVDEKGVEKQYRSRCTQYLGPTVNSQVDCLLLFDARTEIVAGVKPSQTSVSDDAAKAEALRDGQRALDIVALGTNLLNTLWAVQRSPAGDYDGADIPKTFGKLDFSTAGWYLHETDIFATMLFAGPYADRKSCLEDLPRAAASAAAQGYNGYKLTDCSFFKAAP